MQKHFSNTFLCMGYVLLFLCFETYSAYSQNPDLFFQHLTVNNGMINNTVLSTFQDKMGFMWFATYGGLNKYDGTRFTGYQYKADDSLSIASNQISALLEDSYGNFWVGNVHEGLNLFDREKEIFLLYACNTDDKGSLSNNNVRAIFEDSRKNLWIGTAGGGLNLYDRATDSFVHFLNDSLTQQDIGSNYITSIAEDQNGYLWLGSSEGIITKFDVETKKAESVILFSDSDIISNLINPRYNQIYIDSDNNIWFSSENGLYFYDQQKDLVQHFQKGNTYKDLNANLISDIIEYEKDLFLISTDHGGINIYDKNKGTFIYHMHSEIIASTISTNQLTNFYKSPDGIIWVGSFQGGVNILNVKAKKFLEYEDLVDDSEFINSHHSIFSLCEDKDRNIWIGFDGYGIDILNPGKRTVTHLRSNNPNSISSDIITDLYKDSNDNIWIGTYLKGLSKFDWKTKQYNHYQHDPENRQSIAGNNIYTILEDSDGIFWIGIVNKGVDRLDTKTNTFTHFQHDPEDPASLACNYVFKLYKDNAGQIWVGTWNGLCLLNKNTGGFKRFTENNGSGLFGRCVYDIYQDASGKLWIGTDQGLNLYRPENQSFESIPINNEEVSIGVVGIGEDKNNNLWISTNQGLYRFNIIERQFRKYDIADGLQGDEYNISSVLRSSDGKLYFGGVHGFNVFHPDSIKDNPRIPPVYITKLLVFNTPVNPRQDTTILSKHINFEKQITLSYKQSNIELEFAALNYSNPQRNQYAYWLEGFDTDWNYIENNHAVKYTNLDPGDYVFRVKGSNNDGVWNEEGVSLYITILPPWWKTLGFKSIFYITITGLIVFLYYLGTAFHRRQQKKLQMLIHKRTHQLEKAAGILEKHQEEINQQNEELKAQKKELEHKNIILIEQKQYILDQNKEIDKHRHQLESLVKERTRELLKAKEKAEESDKLKSSFLANMSHEIRTPLNAILGFSSLLTENRVKNDKRREQYNAIIRNSCKTLLDLINDILEISKIESGQLELHPKEVLLEEVINNMIGLFDMLIKRKETNQNKRIELKINIEETILKTRIITDKLRLEQVLTNLISNAIKFTNQGYIEIGCSKTQDINMLQFYVKDTGVGMKDEDQHIVFDRFRKIEKDVSNIQRGAGLGLTISKQLVNILGGSIYLNSKIGEGSVFYFTIPLMQPDSTYKADVIIKRRNQIPNLSGFQILVAEDDESNFIYIQQLLHNTHAKIIHAINGKEVLKIMSNHHQIQLILMDIRMPVIDGIQTLHELKKLNVRIPVIAQTAYSMEDEVIKLRKEGFDDYISKPIQREQLYCILKKYLTGKEC